MSALPAIAVGIPLAGALGIALAGRRPNLREAVTFVTGAALVAATAALWPAVAAGERPRLALLAVSPELEIRVRGGAAGTALRHPGERPVARHLALLRRLHEGARRTRPDPLLRVLRGVARGRHRSGLRRQRVHSLRLLRDPHPRDLAARHPPRRRRGATRRPGVCAPAARGFHRIARAGAGVDASRGRHPRLQAGRSARRTCRARRGGPAPRPLRIRHCQGGAHAPAPLASRGHGRAHPGERAPARGGGGQGGGVLHREGVRLPLRSGPALGGGDRSRADVPRRAQHRGRRARPPPVRTTSRRVWRTRR